jgi:hypothetical protein
MNLFRSEEHARRWTGFRPEAEGGLLTLAQMMEAFSAPMFRERGAGDYISRYAQLRPGFLAGLKQITGDHPFWRLKG